MPNHITNRIQLEGSTKDIEQLVDTFSTHIPKHFNQSGNEIICHKIGGNYDDYGWLNAETDLFTTRDDRVGIKGLPDGWSKDIVDAWDHFPDFEKIIPMPKEILNTQGDGGMAPGWYSWSLTNWGTKWNSYSNIKVEDGWYEFDTAWSGVPNLILKMSEKFPDILIKYGYADEDIGANVALFEIKRGEIINSYHPIDGSKEAYDIAFGLKPDSAESYKLVDGKYEYIDED